MAKKKEWREGEIALVFNLTKIIKPLTPKMIEWMDVEKPVFSVGEQYLFDDTYEIGQNLISTWSEEDLKMHFISPVLKLGKVMTNTKFVSFFDKKLTAEV